MGLKQLGCDVFFVEQIEPAACVDASGAPVAFADSQNLAYFKHIAAEAGIAEQAALVCGGETYGRRWLELCDLAAGADLLINISGHLAVEPLFGLFRRKA